MTNYTKTTDFAAKDSLPSGDSGKIIRGAEFGTEFDNIETAVNSKSNKENPSFTGNITVTGTVDGRDISADGTKLDTIETSADVTDTANVTAAGAVMDSELTDITAVKALNQGVATTDSPTFAAVTSTGNVTVGGTVDGRDVAADGTKLDTVETNADVTDTTNVTAAGALMDSEVTNLDQVKAFDSADYATAAQGTTADNALPKTGGAMTGAITTNSTFDGRDVATDGTKLDGIEASADVTDTANVTAAGAVMDSELTSEAAVKALNQGVATTDSPTFAGATVNGTVEFDGLSGTGAVTVTDILDQDDMSGNSATALATQQSIKSYVDSQVATSDTLAEVLANGNATGGTDVAFGDNDKAIFGAGSDLQIYHDGSNSFVEDTGTGALFAKTNGTGVFLYSGSEALATFNTNGASNLYYDNGLKLSTTSTGIDVTGTVTAEDLIADTTRPEIFLKHEGTQLGGLRADALSKLELKTTASYPIFIQTNGTNVANFAVGGDVSFYNSSGTSQSLFWDASAESLRVGSTAAIFTNSVIAGVSALGPTIGGKQTVAAQSAGGFWNSDTGIVNLVAFFAGSGGTQIGSIKGTSTGVSLFGSGGNGLTVNSSGNVGIGISSPDTLVHAYKASNAILKVAEANGYASLQQSGVNSYLNSVSSGGSLIFRNGTAPTERMRIDSSGNVQVKGGNELRVYRADNATYGSIKYLTGSGGLQLNDQNGDGISFVQAGGATEYGRFDASGNFLVGTTDTTLLNNTSGGGFSVSSNGFTQIAKQGVDSADPVLILNQTGLDGEIQRFYKDGTTVGSIGTSGGLLVIGDSDCGIAFEDGSTNHIYPWNVSGGAANNDAISLGANGAAFKDLYLSGGVYLGGTGSANLLDDYEEGTWTVGFSGGSVTASNNVGKYTKIGRVVYFSYYSSSSTIASASGAAEITGLPFTVASGDQSYQPFYTSHNTFFGGSTSAGVEGYANAGNTNLVFMTRGTTTSASLVNGSTKYIMLAGFYLTTA